MEEIVDLGKFTSDGAGASLLWEPIMCVCGGNRKIRESNVCECCDVVCSFVLIAADLRYFLILAGWQQ